MCIILCHNSRFQGQYGSDEMNHSATFMKCKSGEEKHRERETAHSLAAETERHTAIAARGARDFRCWVHTHEAESLIRI